MRKGPHPLPVHLGLVAANMKGVEQYTACFDARLDEDDAVQIVRGIQMYQNHPCKRQEQGHNIVWQSGTTTIMELQNVKHDKSASSTPLLLVPSLINKSHIFDISPYKSMFKWLNAQGIKTYLLDWGEIKDDDACIENGIEDIIKSKLAVAIQHVSDIHDTPIDALGYCMGGNLLLGAHGFASEHIRRMILLATPWDFHEPSVQLACNIRLWSPYALEAIDKTDILPSEWVQALFASLDARGSAQKFMRFASMDQDTEEAELFVLVEDWLNDGVDLPKSVAQHCIQKWFSGNVLANNEWKIGPHTFIPEDVKNDILLIASDKDQLVPYKCAVHATESLVNAKIDVMKRHCGHIGLIVGRNAETDVWYPIHKWLMQK